jgi:hypothetical protein
MRSFWSLELARECAGGRFGRAVLLVDADTTIALYPNASTRKLLSSSMLLKEEVLLLFVFVESAR